MKLTYEANNQSIEKDINEKDLFSLLDELEPNLRPFYILENDNGDFIQCAGAKNRLAIESRFYEDGKFKHFVIGKTEMDKTWYSIICKVGPINVLGHEVLTIDDAKKLFLYFFSTGKIHPDYNQRNITKQFN